MDKVILGKNCVIGEDKSFMPNDNQIVIGCSGTGKSMSVMLPNLLGMTESSVIATYAKRTDARRLAAYMERKGYETLICDLEKTDESTIGFDPLKYITDYIDVEDLARAIVFADPRHSASDRYWDDSAVVLLTALIEAAMMRKKSATMTDVLELFDSFRITENGKGIATTLDELFADFGKMVNDCHAVNTFADYQQLPYTTAGCVRDTLAKALRRMFPEPLKELMKRRETVDFRKLADKKTALIIITSSVNTSLYFFANMIFSSAIGELLEYASECEEQRLPRKVKLMFDDFACSAKIDEFAKKISIFRAAGISTMMLCQSESQLASLYSEDEAVTIINNCSAYVYFPGGMDLKTCRCISQRLDVPMADVMYAETGKVIIMRSGTKPIICDRFDVLSTKEYSEFAAISAEEMKLRNNTRRHSGCRKMPVENETADKGLAV